MLRTVQRGLWAVVWVLAPFVTWCGIVFMALLLGAVFL